MFKAFKKPAVNAPVQPEKIAGGTHVGLVREHNEDSYLYVSLPGEKVTLVVVTDGMGGHEGGEFASFFATEALSSIWCQSAKPSEAKLRESEQVLVESIQNCNDKIYSINEKLNVSRAMGTTITAGLFIPGKLIVAHVGDSRAYMLRNGKLTQLTEDQTWVAKMVKMGNLRPEDAENHPLSHLLSNCMGAGSALDVQVSICRRKQNDRFMFCSDGLYGSLTDKEIATTMRVEKSPRRVLNELIARSLEHGGKDNITGIVIFDD
jgi:serine/threonine protein phosphatase PrpC